MVLFKSPQAKAWFLVNILIPIAPFLVGTIVRITHYPINVSWENFSASDLAISMGFMSLLLIPSIMLTERVLDNQDKKHEALIAILLFGLAASFFFVSYGILSYCKISIYEEGDISSLATLII